MGLLSGKINVYSKIVAVGWEQERTVDPFSVHE